MAVHSEIPTGKEVLMRYIIYDIVFPVGLLVLAFILLWLALSFNAKQQAIYTCEAVTYDVVFLDPETIEAPEWCEK